MCTFEDVCSLLGESAVAVSVTADSIYTYCVKESVDDIMLSATAVCGALYIQLTTSQIQINSVFYTHCLKVP